MNKLSLPAAIVILAICILISGMMISGAIRDGLSNMYDWDELNQRLMEIGDVLEGE
ncbi:hypothetical protein [Pradoshia eiseniae]|uniref:hypothetical protein n=1 Tax=Pradoshia eiseniae TaxID=2064768 RepID=UPI001374F046|nr:hypothetical protein [Pradoshia eiseniae]